MKLLQPHFADWKMEVQRKSTSPPGHSVRCWWGSDWNVALPGFQEVEEIWVLLDLQERGQPEPGAGRECPEVVPGAHTQGKQPQGS